MPQRLTKHLRFLINYFLAALREVFWILHLPRQNLKLEIRVTKKSQLFRNTRTQLHSVREPVSPYAEAGEAWRELRCAEPEPSRGASQAPPDAGRQDV